MGVPKFYRWMSERYPCLNQVVRESEIPEFDNLYLDMNGIIHACSHPNDEDVHFRLPEEVMVKDIFKYIEVLFNIIKPRKIFFMAVDGVAPRAKMNQQRGRRFRSAKDAITRETEAQNKGEVLPKEARFDSNCITPGTDFMARLQKHLEYFVASKISNDELWKNVKVILSGHETPGEGEHKIMDFIRTQRSLPDYDANTRHCLYGLDADLIMLGMCSHEPYFALLREEVKFRRRKEKEPTFHVNPEAINFHLLHLSLLRDYLDHEFSSLKKSLPFDYDLECIIDDWVLMGFLCGNDFIPHLPHFHIGKNALTTLYKVYMDVLPSCNGYLNHQGKLNLQNFQKFLHKLSEIDVENFNEMNADFKYLESKSSRFKSPKKLVRYEECDGIIGESLESGNDDDSNLIDLGSEEASDAEEEDELSISEEDDTLEDEFIMHKRDYYRTKMHYDDVTPAVLKEQAYCYIKAIQWNLHYYYDGCPSWSWYYPHHYAPYISDVKSFENIDLTFDLGQPFKPFEQLLGVLPAASKEFLPKPYQRLVTDESSPLKDYYPEEFELDLNGKVNSWEAVVVIPFIDEEKLLNAARSCESQLSEREKRRNCHGPHLLFTYSKDHQEPVPSTLPGFLPDIEVSHAKLVKVNKDAYNIPMNQIRKGLLPGIDPDVYTPGFPTLRTMEHTARLEKANIRVFEMPSSGYSILVDLTPKPEVTLKSLLSDYLGKTVYINWPFLVEAKICKICDGEKIFSYNSVGQSESRALRDKEKKEIDSQVKTIAESLKNRRGIHLPHFDFILYCKPLTGCKYNLGSNGVVSLDKQWSPVENCVPLPMAIKDLPIRQGIINKHISSMNCSLLDLCFILNEQYYGDLADIIEVQKKTNKVKVMIQRVAEPDLIEVKNRSYELMSKEYMTNHALAQRLSVNPCIVSRLTGTVMVEKANGNKVNIGLNLKFNTRREYVPGYSQRRDETWLFSWKTLKLMEEYNSKFPELFINLSRLADQKRFQPEQIFNGPNPEAKISEVAAWLKTLPYQNARRMKFDTEALDEVVVKCIEDVLDAHKVFANQYEPITLVYSTNQLYRPANIIGHSPPDPNATFNLFDRVVNVREGISVPLGARGVIIGKTKDKQDDDTYLCDIVFDESFIGGMSYNCSAGRGYRLHPYNLINISYRKKKGSYGVREDFDMAPIQPTKIDQRDKKARQKASPGFKKLINLSPNRNHERHDYSNRREYNDQGNQSYTHHNYSDHRNNKQVISSPIQINHSPKSLFQSPRESNSSDFSSLWNKIRNHEDSQPEESASHMDTTASTAASLAKANMINNELVEMYKNMELKQTENLKSLKLDDTSIDLSLIQFPVLPPPPPKWFEKDETSPIPEALVENHQIFNRVKKAQKNKLSASNLTNQQQQQKTNRNSNTQQLYLPFPRQIQGPRPNKFIPLQVERNKQKLDDSFAKRSSAPHDNKTEHRKNEMAIQNRRSSKHTESAKKSVKRRESRIMVGIGSKPEAAEQENLILFE
ncbi:LOW QUALITY PROTEIN: 5'-3' exoribonuclease 1-like [Tetranychus urticae]|uniref:LOW QUALITY PROTEIN: 5'-3' exoribonuclease 1-like n=1 Tax=Tetranychus urticae TaxID=32264 RepID=UPI000D65726E|nr:LOW QUALITY PROTEIN: 5'-3' exoribonuclease 1-like [Tetranychus urticae]